MQAIANHTHRRSTSLSYPVLVANHSSNVYELELIDSNVEHTHTSLSDSVLVVLASLVRKYGNPPQQVPVQALGSPDCKLATTHLAPFSARLLNIHITQLLKRHNACHIANCLSHTQGIK